MALLTARSFLKAGADSKIFEPSFFQSRIHANCGKIVIS